MNIENILAVADAIEAESIAKFNMDKWVDTSPSCGTVACIAGTCVLMTGAQLKPADDMVDSQYANEQMSVPIGRDFLGITAAQAHDLFLPLDYIRNGAITKEVAVRALRSLAITGKVDWKAALKPNDPQLPDVQVRRVDDAMRKLNETTKAE